MIKPAMTKETDIKSSLMVKPAFSKLIQCTPQQAPCTTYDKASSIFHIRMAEVMAAMLRITAKKKMQRQGRRASGKEKSHL